MGRVPPRRTDGQRTVRGGIPGREVLVPFTWLYTALFVAFGAGVWMSVHGNRALRIAGGLLTAYGLWNIMGA